jgi:hypothetical protein
MKNTLNHDGESESLQLHYPIAGAVHTDSPVKAAVCNFLFPVFLDDFFQQ